MLPGLTYQSSPRRTSYSATFKAPYQGQASGWQIMTMSKNGSVTNQNPSYSGYTASRALVGIGLMNVVKTSAYNILPGKSVLCASFLDYLQGQGIKSFWYFCGYQNGDKLSTILRVLVSQMITTNQDFISNVYDRYVLQDPTASVRVLRQIIQDLLQSISCCRIVIDGLDECRGKEQELVLEDLLPLTGTGRSPCSCKFLIFSRDIPLISRKLLRIVKNRMEISLSGENQYINNTIIAFVNKKLTEMEHDIASLHITRREMDDIAQILIERAEGKSQVLKATPCNRNSTLIESRHVLVGCTCATISFCC